MSDQPQDHGDHNHVHPTPGEVEATHDSVGHDHSAGHAHGRGGIVGFIAGLFSPHSHDAADSTTRR